MIRPKNRSKVYSVTKVCTNVCERKRSAEGVGGGAAGVVPVPSSRSDPAKVINILVHGEVISSPFTSVSGNASLPWALAKVAATVLRVHAHRARMAASTVGAGASQPSREKSFCWLSASGSPDARRRCRTVAVSETAPRQRISRIARIRQMRHVESEVLDLVEPANVHLIEMPVRLELCDRLVVRPQVEVSPAALRSGRPAAQ